MTDPEGLNRGGYKSKLSVAKLVIADYQDVVVKLRTENMERASYLKKCYSALCLTWTHLQKHTTGSLLENAFKPEAVNPELIGSGSPQAHADGIIQVSMALLSAVKEVAGREVELEKELVIFKDSAYDAIAAEPTEIPSPLFRSYDLLVKALAESPIQQRFPINEDSSDSEEEELGSKPILQAHTVSGPGVLDPVTPPKSPPAVKRNDAGASSSGKPSKDHSTRGRGPLSASRK